MFAGIVEKQARVLAVRSQGDILSVRIAKPRAWKLARGQSISVDGVCSTVVKSTASAFEVEYVPETLSKTTMGSLKQGSVVNLERSLRLGQRIDGHPVQGHVDAATPVRQIQSRGTAIELTIKPNAQLARRVALHGSIAINGVSLTVARKHGPNITVALIPHTLKATNLGLLREGDEVNVEVDVTARYALSARRGTR